ncbi:MAG: orotidine-5'-phosphate decarboxylase [Pseudobdellovibrionaceae bacterium]
MSETAAPRIFCAVDTPDLERAKELAAMLAQSEVALKLGMEFFNANGPQGILEVHQSAPDLPLFVDLKYKDIPNTVAGAVRSITSKVKPAYLNVHALGGLEMMKAAKAACPAGVKLLAVTILTSIDEDELARTGQKGPIAEQVKRLALLTKEAGLDGVVCSAHEIELLREACGPDFILMVPGIRPQGADHGDQKRVMTPRQAIDLGATHLVIGRPITGAEDPAKAISYILETL